MFNADFYPTPTDLIEELLSMGVGGRFSGQIRGVDTLNGRILEPSAGKGNIINHIKERNKHLKIDAIENDSDLAGLLAGAGHSIVWSDFLTFKTYREYDAIIMNPPFSAGDKHLLHAIKLASSQVTKDCKIFAIINAETLKNPFSVYRKELARLLNAYDAQIKFVSKGFSEAERKTDVEVALIYLRVTQEDVSADLYKRTIENITEAQPKEDRQGISGALSTFVKKHEVQERLDDISRLVKEYDQAVLLIRNAYEANKQKRGFINYISKINGKTTVALQEVSSRDYEEELEKLKITYWSLILQTDEFMRKLTSKARENLNRQLTAASDLEINTTNIQMLLYAILANSSDMLISSVVSMFEKITSYSRRNFSTNIHYYNGWNTNESYKIGKKIIYPFFTEFGDWDMGARDGSFSSVDYRVKEFIYDLLKAFEPFREVEYDFEMISKGEFKNDVLRFKIFRKGTVHVWFNDLETLNKINYVCGRKFNWLPTDEELRNDPDARDFVNKEFGDIITDVSRLLA